MVITALRDEAGTLRGFAKVTRDLTERRAAEEDARRLLRRGGRPAGGGGRRPEIGRQREQLRVTLASIGDAVVVTDAAGAVTFLNPVAAAADRVGAGRRGRAAAGRGVPRSSTRRPGEPVESPVADGPPGRPGGGAGEPHRPPGQGRAERCRSRTRPPPSGTTGGAVGRGGAGVPRRDRAAAPGDALRASEDRFRRWPTTIPQSGVDGPPGRAHRYWYNRRWYEYTGTTPEQMAGWGWQAVHDPDVLPAVVERWRASVATGEPFDMVFPLKGPGRPVSGRS